MHEHFPLVNAASAMAIDSEMMDMDSDVPAAELVAEKPSMMVPTVQVIPDSPTRRVKPMQAPWDVSPEGNEEDDQMPEEILPSLRSYLEKRRHTLTAVDPMMELPQELRDMLSQRFVQRPISPLGQTAAPEEGFPGAFGMNPALPPYSPTLDLSLAYKEQILQVPPVFHLRAPLGRRASDGAASLAAGIAQFNALRAMTGCVDDGQDNSGSLSNSPLNSCNPIACQSPYSVSPGPSSPQISEGANDSGSDQEPDPDAVARYMARRGGRQRHTLAVTEPASEIPDDLQLRLLQVPLKTRRAVFPPSRERAAREGSFITTPTGIRYNASRRASDGAASILAFKQHLERAGAGGSKRNSLRELQEESLKLQQQYGRVVEEEQQRRQQEQHEFHRQQLYGRRASDGSDCLASTLAQFQQQCALDRTSQELEVERHMVDASQQNTAENLEEAARTLMEQQQSVLEHQAGMKPQDALYQKMQRLNIEHGPGAQFDSAILLHSPPGPLSPETVALTPLATSLVSNSPRGSLLLDDSVPSTSAEPSNFLSANVLSTTPVSTSPFLADQTGASSPVPSPPPSPLISAVPLSQRYPAPSIAPARSSSSASLTEPLTETPGVPQLPLGLPGLPIANPMVNGNDLEELARVHWGLGAGVAPVSSSALLSTFGANPVTSRLASHVGQRSPVHHRRHHTVPSVPEAWNSVELLRRATANNVLNFQNHARDMLNNNVNLEEGVGGRDGILYRTLSPNGTIYADSILKSTSKGEVSPELNPGHLQIAYSCNMTTSKCIPDIISEIKRSLDQQFSNTMYQQSEQAFALQQGGVSMQIEVCPLPNGLNGLRLRRVSGNPWQYKKLCNDLLKKVDL